jgi:hypothetical protein
VPSAPSNSHRAPDQEVRGQDRVVPEHKIVREWELDHGRGGRRYELSMLLVKCEFLTVAEGREAQERAREEEMDRKRARALELKQRIEAGAEFAAVARESSDDAPDPGPRRPAGQPFRPIRLAHELPRRPRPARGGPALRAALREGWFLAGARGIRGQHAPGVRARGTGGTTHGAGPGAGRNRELPQCAGGGRQRDGPAHDVQHGGRRPGGVHAAACPVHRRRAGLPRGVRGLDPAHAGRSLPGPFPGAPGGVRRGPSPGHRRHGGGSSGALRGVRAASDPRESRGRSRGLAGVAEDPRQRPRTVHARPRRAHAGRAPVRAPDALGPQALARGRAGALRGTSTARTAWPPGCA